MSKLPSDATLLRNFKYETKRKIKALELRVLRAEGARTYERNRWKIRALVGAQVTGCVWAIK